MKSIFLTTVVLGFGFAANSSAIAQRHGSTSHASNGHASNGHNSNGHNSNGYNSNGHASNGYNSNDHTTTGHTTTGQTSTGHMTTGQPPLTIRLRPPTSFIAIEAHWLRHWNSRLGVFVYFDPSYNRNYFLDQNSQQYLLLEEQEASSSQGGLLILALDSNGPAAKGRLAAKDMIIEVGGVRTPTFEQMQSALAGSNRTVQIVFINGETGQTESTDVNVEQGRLGVTVQEVY